MKISFAVILLLEAIDAGAQSLTDALGSKSDLSYFAALIQPLVIQYSNLTNVTILAPNNDAVSRLANSSALVTLTASPDYLSSFLSYHIVNGSYPNFHSNVFLPTVSQSLLYANVTGGQRIELAQLSGSTVAVSGLLQRSAVDNSGGSGIPYSGGYIHTLDNFLNLPPNLSTTATALNLTAALGAIEALGLTSLFNTWEGTYLLPNNAAFQRVGSSLRSMSFDALRAVIMRHAVGGPALYLTDSVKNNTFLNPHSVHTINGYWYFDNARIIQPNVLTANGVIHVIDRLLGENSSALPINPATTQDAFVTGDGADVPFTSGIPAPTSVVPVFQTGSSATGTGGLTTQSSGKTGSDTSGHPWKKVGAIAGGTVGGIAGLALVLVAIWFCKRNGLSLHVTTKKGSPVRSATMKSYHKPELDAAEVKLANETVKFVTSNTSTSAIGPPNELSTEEGLRAELAASEIGQQSDSRADKTEHQRHIVEFENQRRLAELEYEHQTRLARIDFEKRMADLGAEQAATGVRSHRDISELEADGHRVAKQE